MATQKNGELLVLASDHFDVFVTTDQNLSFQQTVRDIPLAIIVLRAKTNRLADLKQLVPGLLAVLKSVRPGTATVIDSP